MFEAPAAYGIRKRSCEQLGDIFMVAVTVHGGRAVRVLPEDLGQNVQKIVPVGFFKALRHAVRPGDRYVRIGCGVACEQALFARELRFVCKNGGHGLVEFVAHGFGVGLVRHFNKAFYGGFV